MSEEVRRGRTTSEKVRVSIINPESKAKHNLLHVKCTFFMFLHKLID